MKKMIPLWMLAVIMMLASCSQEEEGLPNETGGKAKVSFNVSAGDVLTRATVADLTRYRMEAYDADGKLTQSYDNADGQFEAFFERDKAYTLLFWADYGDEYYTINKSDGLKNITMTPKAQASGDTKAEAFFKKEAFTLTEANQAEQTQIELRRAVAKVTLQETAGLTGGTGVNLNAEFETSSQFDVNAETFAAPAAKARRTVELPIAEDIAANGTIGFFYTFAPKEDADVQTFNFTYDGEERELSNVPLQANYHTHIIGRFDPRVTQSFSIECNGQWNTSPEHSGSWLKVGDDYTHQIGDKTYDCMVVTAEYETAAVAYKTYCTSDDIDNVFFGGYTEAEAYVKGLGGRFPSETEFRLMVKKGIVANEKNYYIQGNKRAIVQGGSVVNIVDAGGAKEYCYCVFDITNPNL